MPPVLVAYVSGHGFGHFVRTSAVLAQVGSAQLHLRTNGRAFSLAPRAGWAASLTEVDVGPGVIQRGPLESDLEATRAALERYLRDWPRLVDEEAAFLRRVGARLVFADAPPLAFAAAAVAGIPSVAMTNFSWSWIYDGYADRGPTFGEAARLFQRAESQATLLLELAGGGGLEHFATRRPIAPVARPLTRTRAHAQTATRMSFPSTLSSKRCTRVSASSGDTPVRTSYVHPCQGQVTMQPSSSPSASGPP